MKQSHSKAVYWKMPVVGELTQSHKLWFVIGGCTWIWNHTLKLVCKPQFRQRWIYYNLATYNAMYCICSSRVSASFLLLQIQKLSQKQAGKADREFRWTSRFSIFLSLTFYLFQLSVVSWNWRRGLGKFTTKGDIRREIRSLWVHLESGPRLVLVQLEGAA